MRGTVGDIGARGVGDEDDDNGNDSTST